MPLPSRLLRAALVAALAAASPLTVSCSSTDPEEPPALTDEQLLGVYLENAIRYLDLRELDRAEDQARRALEIDPDNERFLLIYGSCRLLKGTAQDIQAAIETFERIPEEKQRDYRVQMKWAAAVERKGVFYEEASRGVRDGSRATDAPNRGQRADELMAEAQGYWREAKGRFEESNELRSGEPETIGGLVRTTALLGETEESIRYGRDLIDAIRASQRLVSIKLEDDSITADRETQLFANRRSNRAYEVKARLHIATLLRQEGRLAEAIEEFDEIIYLQPELAEAHSLRAQLLYDLGEYVKARDSITRFIELKARTAEFEDPSIRRAYDLQERCDQAIRSSGRG
ncbi:MAG: tetratricopeptide repeat protein [Planctomycetota bacterium]